MSIEDVNPKRPANGRWRNGTSGNPAGRPTGSRNQSTVFFQELLNCQGEALIQKGIELSLKGDTRALGICWDRLLSSIMDTPHGSAKRFGPTGPKAATKIQTQGVPPNEKYY